MNEAIREIFLTEWVHNATTEEIVEKLIQNDERAKKINEAIEIIKLCDTKCAKELLEILGAENEFPQSN